VQRHDPPARSGELQRRQPSTTPTHTALVLLEQYPYRSTHNACHTRSLYTICADLSVVTMQAPLAAKCRSDLLHSLLAVNLPSTTHGPARYVEKHRVTRFSAEKGHRDMHSYSFANTFQAFRLAMPTLCTWRVTPNTRSLEGSVPHPGLLRV